MAPQVSARYKEADPVSWGMGFVSQVKELLAQRPRCKHHCVILTTPAIGAEH